MYFFVKSRRKSRGTWMQFFLPKLCRVADGRNQNSQQYPITFQFSQLNVMGILAFKLLQSLLISYFKCFDVYCIWKIHLVCFTYIHIYVCIYQFKVNRLNIRAYKKFACTSFSRVEQCRSISVLMLRTPFQQSQDTICEYSSEISNDFSNQVTVSF